MQKMISYNNQEDNIVVCKSSELVECTRCEQKKADILIVVGKDMISLCKGCGRIVAQRILLRTERGK